MSASKHEEEKVQERIVGFLFLRMVKFSISNARYTYIDDGKYPSEAVDVHQIVVRKSGAKHIFVYITALLVLASAFYLHVLKEKSITVVYYSLLFDIFLVKLLLRKPVERESVVIMPAFGVQLETHYTSGKVNRCFVPIDKILEPVLLECVTPVTCYWTLSLIIRGESELLLVFKNLRPPVKMLVQVWKALRAATGYCSVQTYRLFVDGTGLDGLWTVRMR
ncbi:hypothetical protein L6164_020259 [Bauhinia variegata]|uniref:Uncharacterized protein n=1 Tax=Bauhinia variegata TaxID=167791 RepID=A0ACB9MVV1_BAUVA|nr:hypothetical protein L6164_020259 [Bauhinia variegata]